jgi:hypothetical protein
MKKKILISSIMLFFLPVMLTLLQSCLTCRGMKQTYFEVTKMYLVTKVGGSIYDDTEIPVSSINQVSFWLRTDVRYYGSINLFSGGFSAMALSCDAIPQSKETIESIEVYSDKDFEGFSAGTNLVSIFKILEFYNFREQNVLEYLATKQNTQEEYKLFFEDNVKPATGLHQFKIIFTDSKNRTFEMNTEVNFK